MNYSALHPQQTGAGLASKGTELVTPSLLRLLLLPHGLASISARLGH